MRDIKADMPSSSIESSLFLLPSLASFAVRLRSSVVSVLSSLTTRSAPPELSSRLQIFWLPDVIVDLLACSDHVSVSLASTLPLDDAKLYWNLLRVFHCIFSCEEYEEDSVAG